MITFDVIQCAVIHKYFLGSLFSSPYNLIWSYKFLTKLNVSLGYFLHRSHFTQLKTSASQDDERSSKSLKTCQISEPLSSICDHSPYISFPLLPKNLLNKTTIHKRRHTYMMNYRPIKQLTRFSHILDKVHWSRPWYTTTYWSQESLASTKEHLLKIEYAAYKQIYSVLKSHNQKCKLEEFHTIWPGLLNLSSMKSH
jgi:hypothetical protein